MAFIICFRISLCLSSRWTCTFHLSNKENDTALLWVFSPIYRSDASSCRQMRDCRRWIQFDGSFKQTSTDSLPCSPNFSRQNWANWPAKSMKSHRHEDARQYARPALLSHKEYDLKIYHFTSIYCSNSGIFIVFVKKFNLFLWITSLLSEWRIINLNSDW